MISDKINDPFFDNINGYKLDYEQRKVILNNSNNLLVVAGAGSGKTLTILGKIKYLVEKLHVNYQDILCLSFTNETVNNLKTKLSYPIDVFTFHKLSLEILKDHHIPYQIAPVDLLEYVVNEYLEAISQTNREKYVLDYFNYLLKEKNLTLTKIKEKFPKEFLAYKKLLIKFINLSKCNNLNITSLKKMLKKNNYLLSVKKRYKNKCFLLIFLDIYFVYLEEVNSSLKLDFDMMINKATKVISLYGMKRYYKYIIIDEFQDASLARYNLIKEIQEKCDSKLLVVGDDFQSIYGFSGCTLELFINFKKYFPHSKILYLINTYRNSKELVKIAYRFIKKNSYQLSKVLVSLKSNYKPVKIVYYTESNYKYKFERLLEKLYSEKKDNLLVLGRCNYDINYVYDKKESDYIIYKDMKIKYLTVHRAKGLEANEVIVLNLRDDRLGFPNKIEDDEIINLFFLKKEKFLYAEERRLFYVALTRTKNNVYLMVQKDKVSSFIKEIKNKCEVIDI